MQSQIDNLHKLLSKSLQDSNEKVKLAALKTTISLILAVPDDKISKLQSLVPMLFQTLGQAYKAKDDDVIIDAIKVLSELASKRPKCLRGLLKEVVISVAKMAADRELEVSTRLSALEFLITLAEAGKGMVRKLKEFPQLVIPIVFGFMLQLEVGILSLSLYIYIYIYIYITYSERRRHCRSWSAYIYCDQGRHGCRQIYIYIYLTTPVAAFLHQYTYLYI